MRGGPSVARIRTIKPELFNDDAIIAASCEAIVAFIGIFCHCDANGVFEAKWQQLKRSIFPERVLSGSFEGLVRDQLSSFIVLFEDDGHLYGCVRTFRKHQKIDPSNDRPRFPVPPGFTLSSEGVWIQDKSSAGPAKVQPKSSAGTAGEGKEGKEGKGKERKDIVVNFTKVGEESSQISDASITGRRRLTRSVSSASQRGNGRGMARAAAFLDGAGVGAPVEVDAAVELERQKARLRGEA